MKSPSILSLAALLIAAPAFAATSPRGSLPAPTSEKVECVIPSTVKSNAHGGVLFDFKGEALLSFNEKYFVATGAKSPPFDELVVVNYGSGEMVILFGFVNGCGLGAGAIKRTDFDTINNGPTSAPAKDQSGKF